MILRAVRTREAPPEASEPRSWYYEVDTDRKVCQWLDKSGSQIGGWRETSYIHSEGDWQAWLFRNKSWQDCTIDPDLAVDEGL